MKPSPFNTPFPIIVSLVLICLAGTFSPAQARDTQPAKLGFSGYPLMYVRTYKYDQPFPKVQGFYVKQVNEDAPSVKNGLRRGNIITKINGKPVRSMDNIEEIMSQRRYDTVSFELYAMSPRYEKKLRENPFYKPSGDEVYERSRIQFRLEDREPKKLTVLVHSGGELYHRPGYNHSPDPRNSNSFSSIEQAREEGYNPCPICFPGKESSLIKDIWKREMGESKKIVKNLTEKYQSTKDIPSRLKKVAIRLFRQRLREEPKPHITLLKTKNFYGLGLKDGSLILSNGLMSSYETERGLAGQVAHQLAHTDLRHDHKAVEVQQFRSLLEEAVKRTTGVSFTFQDLRDLSPNLPGFTYYRELLEQGYGEDNEHEALFFAMVYLYKAGYDFSAIKEIIAKRKDMQNSVHPRWLDYLLQHPHPRGVMVDYERWSQLIPKRFERDVAP
ncbi:MAG: PDZ domain-containing protein [bacterium]